jgi:hypothetical protein
LTFSIEEAARALEDHVRERYEESGSVLVRIGKPPKRAIPFRTIEPFAKFVVNLTAPNGSAEKIEFLADGAQVAAFGIHPETKQPFRWHGGQPGDTKLEELPYIREAEAHALVDELVQILVERFGYTKAKERPGKRKSKGNGQDADAGAASHGPADWQYLCDRIRAGEALHDSLRDLAAKLVASGMGPGAAVNFLRGLMGSSAPHDARWRERYAEIARQVDSAADKRQARTGEAPPQPSGRAGCANMRPCTSLLSNTSSPESSSKGSRCLLASLRSANLGCCCMLRLRSPPADSPSARFIACKVTCSTAR